MAYTNLIYINQPNFMQKYIYVDSGKEKVRVTNTKKFFCFIIFIKKYYKTLIFCLLRKQN